ncbi:hypothetical protein JW710_01330 [Candidatus Dojkabacteria bacterium]|nr:hypothetical protein [Candidatus Dojkabacteria bacterium]
MKAIFLSDTISLQSYDGVITPEHQEEGLKALEPDGWPDKAQFCRKTISGRILRVSL